MQAVRRSAIAWCLAALAPLSLLGILYFALQLQQTRRLAEDVSLDKARSYLALVDARLDRDLGALDMAAVTVRPGAEEALKAAFAMFPNWKAVGLSDLATRRTTWLTSFPLADAPALEQEALDFARLSAPLAISGIDKARAGCLCFVTRKRIAAEDGKALVLTLVRDASDFLELLKATTEKGCVGALVDRDGAFVARSLDNETRAGKQATAFVRNAVARGGEGVYSGVTLEGLTNRTAYATSAMTGWSAHLAAPAGGYKLLSAGYAALSALAVLAALAFAGGAAWLGLRELETARQRERSRQQSYKLEAVGALASAVVHDFNNLLAIMDACLRLLARTDDAAKKTKYAQEGMRALDRGGKLVNQLLAFVRQKPPELSCVDLRATVEDIHDLLARALGENVEFRCEIAPDAQFVRANRSQLELVLLNLSTNARDAMPTGGRFSIASRIAPGAGDVELIVRDTGPGMSKEVAARAFEPFFTTKPEGKGTGLGLAQAQLLAKDCDGALSLTTAPGKGCVFTFRFHACAPEGLVAGSG